MRHKILRSDPCQDCITFPIFSKGSKTRSFEGRMNCTQSGPLEKLVDRSFLLFAVSRFTSRLVSILISLVARRGKFWVHVSKIRTSNVALTSDVTETGNKRGKVKFKSVRPT